MCVCVCGGGGGGGHYKGGRRERGGVEDIALSEVLMAATSLVSIYLWLSL